MGRYEWLTLAVLAGSMYVTVMIVMDVVARVGW